MTEASGYLTGKHDFSCFRASGCSSKNPVREIIKIEISEPSSIEFFSFKFDVPIVRISIQANAFLRHMARNIVGTLVEIGRDKSPASKIIEILDSKDRRTAGQTAPARGLFLEKITY
jgi:tRNA pseudouridine38-40 synthase